MKSLTKLFLFLTVVFLTTSTPVAFAGHWHRVDATGKRLDPKGFYKYCEDDESCPFQQVYQQQAGLAAAGVPGVPLIRSMDGRPVFVLDMVKSFLLRTAVFPMMDAFYSAYGSTIPNFPANLDFSVQYSEHERNKQEAREAFGELFGEFGLIVIGEETYDEATGEYHYYYLPALASRTDYSTRPGDIFTRFVKITVKVHQTHDAVQIGGSFVRQFLSDLLEGAGIGVGSKHRGSVGWEMGGILLERAAQYVRYDKEILVAGQTLDIFMEFMDNRDFTRPYSGRTHELFPLLIGNFTFHFYRFAGELKQTSLKDEIKKAMLPIRDQFMRDFEKHTINLRIAEIQDKVRRGEPLDKSKGEDIIAKGIDIVDPEKLLNDKVVDQLRPKIAEREKVLEKRAAPEKQQ